MSLTILNPNATAAPPTILGIDLGTTFSLAAYRDGSTLTLVRGPTGDVSVPSVLAFGADGRVTVGVEARAHALEDPEHTVFSVKRLIGKTLAELKDDLPFVPYQVVERQEADGRKVLRVRLGDREQTPEELSAVILRELAARAAKQLGRPVSKAVVTVPAYFDEAQRQATRDAGRLAGLDVVRIVNEPTAAALAYGLHERREGTVAVYDFGGGTFDCSILLQQAGVFKVLATHGDTRLGGDDVDRALIQVVEAELTARGVSLNPHVRQGVRDVCEKTKIALSTAESVVLRLSDEVAAYDPALKGYERTVTRAEFDELIRPLVERTLAACRAALRDAGLSTAEVDEVVLVGGSSRLPLVRRRVAEMFGRTPRCDLDPDQVVALGAAVQAGILAGELRQILLLDVTPLSLGLETIGGAVSRLVPRNSTIPAQATERFTTYVDDQTGVDLHIVQGERELAKDCRSLGRFKLSGLPPGPAGLPRIDVTFLIDADGLLQVTAREQRSGRAAHIEVQPSQGLTRDEVEAMLRAGLEQAAADFAARKLIDLRTKADANLTHTRKGLANAGDRAPADLRAAVQAAVTQLESVRTTDDAPALQSALDALDAATRPLAELLLNTVLEKTVVAKRLDEL
ncbi:MAG: Fe-S protein assembly chaperone HscA [Planctomycetia bacterium]